MRMQWPQRDQDQRVRDLLRRIGATEDHAECADLFSQIADKLDAAAGQITAWQADSAAHRQLVAALQGQADMARFMAELERARQARQMAQAS